MIAGPSTGLSVDMSSGMSISLGCSVARHYPCRDNSFNKKHWFFAPWLALKKRSLIEISHISLSGGVQCQ